jgi:hypothetical protein
MVRVGRDPDDLYLRCAKFVTTPHYAPRLRDRLQVEESLIGDAVERGWEREAQRHRGIADRICDLLAELEEQTPDAEPEYAPEEQPDRELRYLR